MDSFKLYLPSNASTQLYPSNSPSDYRTRLNQPIDVNGNWEVGLESIFYSSNFHEETEKAQIDFKAKIETSKTVNSIYPYEMVTGSTWKGIGEVTPKTFESNPKKVQSVLDSINSINDLILNPRKEKVFGRVFGFTLNDDKSVKYTSYDHGFTLKISSNLAEALGFGTRMVFSDSVSIKATSKKPKDMTLAKDDYKMTYFNTKVLQKKDRIVIKPVNEKFDGTEKTFLDLWATTVQKKYNISTSFHDNLIVLHNYDSNIVVTFSKDFQTTFGHEWNIFDKHKHQPINGHTMKEGLASQVWYIDVYSKLFDLTSSVSYYNVSMDIYPWRYKTHKKLYAHINQTVSTHLKEMLKDKYDTSKHSFTLSLHHDTRCQLHLGDGLNVSFSKNLSYLLGFPKNVIAENELTSVREVTTLIGHRQQLFCYQT